MRTTVDLPDGLLDEAQRRCDFPTKREAVVAALEEMINKARREEFVRRLGTFDYDFTLEDLKKMRASD